MWGHGLAGKLPRDALWPFCDVRSVRAATGHRNTEYMVDPISVAGSSAARAVASIVAKQLQPKAVTRLGSRDERRQVYARFQAAATDIHYWVALLSVEDRLLDDMPDGLLEKQLARLRTPAQGVARSLMHKLVEIQRELMQAYMDLCLAANPEPLRAATDVLNRCGAVYKLETQAGRGQYLRELAQAQGAFIQACREDLWYLPQRWQIYRPAWWSARRWRRKRSTES